MQNRKLAAALSVVLVAGLLAPANAVDKDIKKYICAKLDDFQATGVVISADQRALAKIGKDFGYLYKFKTVLMRYKEPSQIRIDGNIEASKGTFVVTENSQTVSLNGTKFKSNFANAPGKRKTLMDVGLISEYYLTYTTATFEREGTVDGAPVAIFDMKYKPEYNDSSHHRVYIDEKKRAVLKRESYSQDGKLQATYFYKNHVEIKGVWFPTRLEAQNVDRVVAGVTEYKDIKVNIGLDDAIFKL